MFQRFTDAWAVLRNKPTNLDLQHQARILQLESQIAGFQDQFHAQECAIAQATSNFQSFLKLNDIDKRAAIILRSFPRAPEFYGNRIAMDVILDMFEGRLASERKS
jgi:hypothetical protein